MNKVTFISFEREGKVSKISYKNYILANILQNLALSTPVKYQDVKLGRLLYWNFK